MLIIIRELFVTTLVDRQKKVVSSRLKTKKLLQRCRYIKYQQNTKKNINLMCTFSKEQITTKKRSANHFLLSTSCCLEWHCTKKNENNINKSARRKKNTRTRHNNFVRIKKQSSKKKMLL